MRFLMHCSLLALAAVVVTAVPVDFVLQPQSLDDVNVQGHENVAGREARQYYGHHHHGHHHHGHHHHDDDYHHHHHHDDYHHHHHHDDHHGHYHSHYPTLGGFGGLGSFGGVGISSGFGTFGGHGFGFGGL